MTTGRTVPDKPEEELTITINLPAGMKLRKVIELEEAMSAGVSPLVEWLVANAGCDREQLLDLDWNQMEQLRNAIKQAVIAAGKVPPRTS